MMMDSLSQGGFATHYRLMVSARFSVHFLAPGFSRWDKVLLLRGV